MDYVIQITGPTSSGTSVFLTEDVYRVGREQACEIQIPCSIPHALTVFRRSGVFYLTNRSRQAVQFGGKVLSPDSTRVWSVGTRARVDGIYLELRVSPTQPHGTIGGPVGKKNVVSNLEFTAGDAVRPAAADAPSTSTKRQTGQMMIIFCCVAAIIGLQCLGSDYTPYSKRYEDQLALSMSRVEQLSLSKLCGLATRDRADQLLHLLSRYRFAMKLSDRSAAQALRSDIRAFTMGIANSTKDEVSEEERRIALSVAGLLATPE